MTDLVAHDAREVVRIGFLGTLWNAEFRSEALRGVRAGRDNGARGGEDPGTGNNPLRDGLAKFDLGIAGAFGSEITDGREAGH